ncbi:MAG: hypothetical protein M3P27_12310 [Acidobacteriota bacterium]|nr:hypothetical protein [Acidobacteriota bacterium]
MRARSSATRLAVSAGVLLAGLLVIASLSVASPACLAAEPPPQAASVAVAVPAHLPVEEVVSNMVRRNRERAQALPAYRSTRVYHLEYHGFPGSRSAEVVVDMEYAPPTRKEFVVRSQTGSKLLIDRVIKKALESEKEAFDVENQKRTALNHDNYLFTLVGYESTPQGGRYVLAVEPKTGSKFLYRGKIWVDADDFAVTRIEAQPAKNPSFWIRSTQIEQVYGKVSEFWLPARNHSVSKVRLGGSADFTIEYKDYQWNGASPLASGAAPGKVPGEAVARNASGSVHGKPRQ